MKITSAELMPGTLTESAASGFFTKEKHKLVYALSVIFFTGMCSYFFGSMIQQTPSLLSAIIFTAIFFCIGLLHIFLFLQWIPPVKSTGFNPYLLYSFAMAVIVSSTSFIIFWSSGFHLKNFWVITGIGFLLPSLVLECWKIFAEMLKVHYKAWHFSSQNLPEKKMSLLLNSILFKIHVQLKHTDDKGILFNVTLPRKLAVDAVFRHFFYDHQKIIELYEHNQPYGWYFFIKTWYGSKALNPDLSLAENGVKEDVIIYAKRVIHSINN